jgi:predicted ester cyclase
MSTTDSETLERRREMPHEFAEAVFEDRNFAFIVEEYDEDWVGHVDGETMTTAEYGEQMEALLAGFPDAELSFEAVVADGDYLATRWEMTGTHEGELYGLKPTGRSVRVTGNTMTRFEGEEAVEMWETIDRLGMLQQLGIAPEDFTLGDMFRTLVNVLRSSR